MLQIKKSIMLTGNVVIDGFTVVTLQANISSEAVGNTYISQNLVDQNLYNDNRKQCRQEIADFQEKVYAVEDQLIEEKTVAEADS